MPGLNTLAVGCDASSLSRAGRLLRDKLGTSSVVYSQSHKYNLILLHTPGKQDVSDFLTIKNMMLGRAPEIQTLVFSLPYRFADQDLRQINRLPTLVFSPMPIELNRSIRGTRLIVPKNATKEAEIKLLSDAGFPVPQSFIITNLADAPKFDSGPFVVVKPNRGSQGKDVKLVRADELLHYGKSISDPTVTEFMIQEWIDTGAFPSSYRVLTALGEPIYCVKSTALNMVVDIQHIPPEGILVCSNGQERKVELANDEDVIELAKRIHRTLSFTPVMGIDILRHQATKKLYIIELNSAGWTWHLSSNHGKGLQMQFHLDIYNQFGALKVLTEALIGATRNLAC